MDRRANCCNHGGWFTLALAVGTTTSYFSVFDECVDATCIFGDGYRGSMVKVPVKCAYFRLLLSGLLSIPCCQSLSRSLFVSSTCASQISLRRVRRERGSPGKFSETKKKEKKVRYERIVVKCLLLANLGNWTHAVLDLLWCQSW